MKKYREASIIAILLLGIAGNLLGLIFLKPDQPVIVQSASLAGLGVGENLERIIRVNPNISNPFVPLIKKTLIGDPPDIFSEPTLDPVQDYIRNHIELIGIFSDRIEVQIEHEFVEMKPGASRNIRVGNHEHELRLEHFELLQYSAEFSYMSANGGEDKRQSIILQF